MIFGPSRLQNLLAASALAMALPVLAQSTTTPTGSSGTTPGAVTGGAAASPMPHGIVPNKSELPISAFNKLDNGNKGYVVRDDVVQLQGFESAFLQADQNRDGRLNASEFNSAWSIYTGQNP